MSSFIAKKHDNSFAQRFARNAQNPSKCEESCKIGEARMDDGGQLGVSTFRKGKIMEQLTRIKTAIWYDYLSGHYTYDFACDLYEILLTPTNALRKEL